MRNMQSWMLGAAVVAGGLAAGAAPAQGAEFGMHMRGPAAYVPPCPGPGYVWIAGYQSDGYWIPGRWNFGGDRGRAPFARFEDEHRGRGFDRTFNRDRDRERGRR